MKDQVDALVRLGFRATVLNSTIEFDERREHSGAAPRRDRAALPGARSAGGSLRSIIAGCDISLSSSTRTASATGATISGPRTAWNLKSELGAIPVLALTATATPASRATSSASWAW
jgi:ATP-dependent DNA helicase RecQ